MRAGRVQTELYAAPRKGLSLEDCLFYHTMEIPTIGLVGGPWDLRPGVREYLGGVDVAGRRVLEFGTASGFLCFSMEQLGADVVAYDLSDEQEWDMVPFADQNREQARAARRDQIRRLNNSWWLAHEKLGSRARVVYRSIYDVPDEIGPFDVVTYGAILLHLRDPFLALQSGLRLARETVVVTESMPHWTTQESVTNSLRFLPDPATGRPTETWWSIPPSVVQRMIGVLGFQSEVSYHEQLKDGQPQQLYTVVGHRRSGRVAVED
jgi:hypothetical protein